MTTADLQQDIPVVPSPASGGDPLGVFHHDRLPPWALVRHRLDGTEIDDVDRAVADAIAPFAGTIRPGVRVCVAVGSRGIDRIAEVARAAVAVFRGLGGDVFAVPAMGSHGGATAEGQLEVLASLGITPETIGCDIRSSMETVQLGTLEPGVPVFFDRHAFEEADVVVPINRVKPHTDFSGPVESGLLKMIAIGLGKQRGADTFHAEGFAAFAELIPAVGRYTLSKVNIPFGLALLENGLSRLRRIEAVAAADIWDREQALRDEADGYLARLPIASLDVLVLDRIGKDISGLGMDSNVVGRYYTGPTGHGPAIQRIVVRDLTDETEGNAVGIGMADVALRRAVDRMDAAKTYMNCITAKTPEGARIALTVESDRQAIDVALSCCIKVEPAAARIVRILDTKHLGWFYATEPLLPELLATGRCDVESEVRPIAFDGRGGFTDVLPE
ncbi:MAG TPA: hypothetical protein VFR93_06245 [Candidatus Limnocylindrales bacterium]|nr:hypothetical protein [Candidatus Limnocylindrales bacterium]